MSYFLHLTSALGFAGDIVSNGSATVGSLTVMQDPTTILAVDTTDELLPLSSALGSYSTSDSSRVTVYGMNGDIINGADVSPDGELIIGLWRSLEDLIISFFIHNGEFVEIGRSTTFGGGVDTYNQLRVSSSGQYIYYTLTINSGSPELVQLYRLNFDGSQFIGTVLYSESLAPLSHYKEFWSFAVLGDPIDVAAPGGPGNPSGPGNGGLCKSAPTSGIRLWLRSTEHFKYINPPSSFDLVYEWDSIVPPPNAFVSYPDNEDSYFIFNTDQINGMPSIDMRTFASNPNVTSGTISSDTLSGAQFVTLLVFSLINTTETTTTDIDQNILFTTVAYDSGSDTFIPESAPAFGINLKNPDPVYTNMSIGTWIDDGSGPVIVNSTITYGRWTAALIWYDGSKLYIQADDQEISQVDAPPSFTPSAEAFFSLLGFPTGSTDIQLGELMIWDGGAGDCADRNAIRGYVACRYAITFLHPEECTGTGGRIKRVFATICG